ncbi:hypothetical protein PPYR_08984 [Photinus pyralis]|uniref:Uncharacterized protein n=1 Tax=Photinus pyralis TaxID=7054 RepID=A0A5N4AL01_PHOPY|nr:protein asteroid [Photinus pyralis]KAB0797991.1 hypothetical protein PPYR_08984 [Photinus pyralis]
MGIRGLTTFIAHRSDSYLKHYKLHDTYLVIDGNSLAANLYQVNRARNDCFGGDYNKFERTLCKFFDLLAKCNITPLIILDGAYEKRKLRTVYQRLKNKLKTLQQVDTVSQTHFKVFPLFLRDLFADVLVRLQLKIIRCNFEADFEIACLARTLNCPVLSYDSDFFVYDVLYIPFVSLEMNAVPHDGGYYLPCQLYEMDYFLKAYGGLNKSCVPLLAVLLGNDYINKNNFKEFYTSLRLVKRKTQQNVLQRSVKSVIKWLQKESYESAMVKVLQKVPSSKRRRIAQRIKRVMRDYMCKNSKLLPDLGISLNCDEEEFELDTERILQESENAPIVNEECDNCDDDDDEEDQEVEDEVEESDCESESEETEEVNCENDFFRTNYRHCKLPTAFMDMLVANKYFCTPQIESATNTCSHLICVKVISAIDKILRPNAEIRLKFVARHQSTNLKWYDTPDCNLELPSLHDISTLSDGTARAHVFSVLEFRYDNFCTDIPKHWQLYFLAMIYWIKNATPSVTHSHVQSLILCMLVMNELEPKNTVQRVADRQQVNDSPLDHFLNEISKTDSAQCCKELKKYFEMEPKMRTSNKYYNKNIVDCFAQFQSSLLHVKYLNALLNRPFADCLISRFYNGTFLYNMCSNLQRRTNIDAYMDTLLKVCPSVLKCFKAIVDMIKRLVASNIITAEAKRRRRKRKNTRRISEASNESVPVQVESMNSEGVAVMDENNRFSLLNFV